MIHLFLVEFKVNGKAGYKQRVGYAREDAVAEVSKLFPGKRITGAKVTRIDGKGRPI